VKEPASDTAYRDSAAARMLADGLANAASERGLSQRALAKLLGYKQSVVLSHMALGRVPIPLERAAQFAELLEIDKRDFLVAVLIQRLPDVDWPEIIGSGAAQDKAGHFVSGLEAIARGKLDGLSAGQQAVMREVVADRHAGERWLSVHEVPTVALLRTLRPTIVAEGLSVEDSEAIEVALTGRPPHGNLPPMF
jgi:DNA-binding transcriptional regulator YdaS (Cro superfamily)